MCFKNRDIILFICSGSDNKNGYKMGEDMPLIFGPQKVTISGKSAIHK